jgi:hypothetical protein
MIMERDKPDFVQRCLQMLAALFMGLVFALLLLAVCIAYQLTVAIPQLQDNSNRIVIVVENQDAALIGFETGLMREAMGTRRDLVASHKDAMAQLAGGMKLGFGTLNYQLAIAQGVLQEEIHGHLERLNGSADTVAGPAGQVFSQLSEAATLSLDCDHNSECFHNQYVGTSQALRQFLECSNNPDCAFNRYVGTARSVEKTADHAEKISNFWKFGWLKFWK